MSLEPLIIFFIIRHMRKVSRSFSPDAEASTFLTRALYAVVVLFVIHVVVDKAGVTIWIWHLLFLVLLAASFKKPEFISARPVMLTVLPLFVVTVFSDVAKLLNEDFYRFVKSYIDFAGAIAFTWMIAMLLRSNKQRKALEKERKKTQEEEARNKYMAIQKAELEALVAERTSELMNQKNELQHAFTELKSAQKQLIQAEKMASLGELTAGIAHEIQNPLNFVNNFSEINTELIDEMHEEIQKGNFEEVKALAGDIRDNEKKIIYHGRRADAIVKSMLQHSRSSSGVKEPTDINALADEYFRLAYHGLRAKDKTFNANIHTEFDKGVQKVSVIPQDIGRALLNLFTNAFYAVSEKKKKLQSITTAVEYEPTVTVGTKALSAALNNGTAAVLITVKDNGNGIPQKVLDKIYQPFFTTKPTGEGTGLGLSLAYDIIKAHGGEIKVSTREGEGSEFIIQLPVV